MSLVNDLDGRLLFAVPKKGRLHQKALELLDGSDIRFHRSSRSDIAFVTNLPLAIIFLPAADIPTFVEKGNVDLGITGRDQVAEYHATHSALVQPQELIDLGFGRCKLQVQVPKNGPYQTSRDLVGKRIVTSFNGLSRKYFDDLERQSTEGSTTNGNGAVAPKTEIEYVGGSVEAACALGIADAVVDLVESGETMHAAGLKAIDTVVESTAVLIQSHRPSNPGLVSTIASRIRGVMTARTFFLCTYNIPRSELSKATAITPGKRGPTISGLDDPAWAVVSAMVKREDAGSIMDELMKTGAEDILIQPIQNSRADK